MALAGSVLLGTSVGLVITALIGGTSIAVDDLRDAVFAAGITLASSGVVALIGWLLLLAGAR